MLNKIKENANEDKCYEKEITCKKIDKNLLNDKVIKTQIRKYRFSFYFILKIKIKIYL